MISLEVRKHITQMDKSEIEFLTSKVKSKSTYNETSYFKNRVIQRRIQIWQITKVLSHGEIVEYHCNGIFEHRVLLRGKDNERGNALCVVLDIFTGDLITAYFNKYEDDHAYLDKDKYDGELDILKFIHSGCKRKY